MNKFTDKLDFTMQKFFVLNNRIWMSITQNQNDFELVVGVLLIMCFCEVLGPMPAAGISHAFIRREPPPSFVIRREPP